MSIGQDLFFVAGFSIRRIAVPVMSIMRLEKSCLTFDGVFVNRRAGNIHIVTAAPEAIEMESERARGCIELEDAAILVIHRIVTLLEHPFRGLNQRIRHATIDDVDDTADRPIAIKQGSRSPDNLDALSQYRFHTFGMIRTDTGDIARRNAVLQDLDPLPGMTPDHRMPHATAVGRRHDADAVLERLAQSGRRIFPQLLPCEYADRHCRLGLGLLERRRNQDFFECSFIMALGRRTGRIDYRYKGQEAPTIPH